ncbi:MAG: transposase [candidate division KSB1 bacterium]|nr:transposase [candidate division KSB1 bacterium]
MKTFYRRYLPHIQPPGATLFVTFRLYGSLPCEALNELQQEYDRFARKLQTTSKAKAKLELYLFQKRLIVKCDRILDLSDRGPQYLKDPRVAQLVCDTIQFWDQQRYDLLSYCVMSNHVHMVFTPLPKPDGSFYSLAKIMHSIKSYTANKANEILKRRGKPFWEHESFDHYCRNEKEVERVITYVLDNPVKAGLVDHARAWPWNYCKFWK